MVECYPSSKVSIGGSSGMNMTSNQEDRTILDLLMRQNEVKDKLVNIMQKIREV